MLLIILGETAVGKTKIANEIAKRNNGEIVVADKFYIYNYFKNSVGRTDEEYEVPSHLIGILQPNDQRPSRKEYAEKAFESIMRIIDRGCLPIIEGCSVGYITALLNDSRLKKYTKLVTVGLKFPNYISPREVYATRFLKLLNGGTVIEEVKEAIRLGFENSYVMRKSVICNPISRFLRKEISRDKAIDEVITGFEKVATGERKSFFFIKDVHWIEHDENYLENTIQKILKIMGLGFQ